MMVSNESVEEARNGDERALDRLIEELWPQTYRLAFAIAGSRQCAEDAAQEACVILYRTIGSLRRVEAFGAWWYRIVVREATRSRKLRAFETLDLNHAYEEDPSSAVDVWQAVAALPALLRTVVILRYFEDLSSREIAKIVRIPDGTVRFQLMLARNRLHRLLDVHDTATLSPQKVESHV
jgi:RNA polymerase sigma-70 factor, ECF subfamily